MSTQQTLVKSVLCKEVKFAVCHVGVTEYIVNKLPWSDDFRASRTIWPMCKNCICGAKYRIAYHPKTPYSLVNNCTGHSMMDLFSRHIKASQNVMELNSVGGKKESAKDLKTGYMFTSQHNSNPKHKPKAAYSGMV